MYGLNDPVGLYAAVFAYWRWLVWNSVEDEVVHQAAERVWWVWPFLLAHSPLKIFHRWPKICEMSTMNTGEKCWFVFSCLSPIYSLLPYCHTCFQLVVYDALLYAYVRSSLVQNPAQLFKSRPNEFQLTAVVFLSILSFFLSLLWI